ncbi:nodal modulator 1-like [Chenopodium quinoa]|uniref:nodal modulator 1-like n=1 Tax=Chenopodium quinoa TaxID=63459 RepID=UPI000B78F397|nr:nodal modulator 1-like [Chenopodium quinoa]
MRVRRNGIEAHLINPSRSSAMKPFFSLLSISTTFSITLLLLAHTTSVFADSIHGCGGFIEASSSLVKSRKSSNAKLDYSHITVELQTLDGLVKDSTQCAPNGYYFIPVYDKGSFIIKVRGPKGWAWEPEKVPVTIDHRGCNANEDINFRFTGFSLSGRVLGAVGGQSCRLKKGGPSNVVVELLSSTDDLISSVSTSTTGDYSFKNVIPGRYRLRASHPDLNVEVRGSTEVEVGFENSVIGDIFSVAGYKIRGHVVAQGNPILGVHTYLYSDDVLEVECPQGAGHGPGDRKALCHAVSDADGKFTFKSIPCGDYELVPYYKGENTVFDISPPTVAISVEHSHVTLQQKFQVTGFSIGGRVVDGNGAGVDGAKVFVDGQERSFTDENGYFTLDQVTSNHYAIEAHKKHYKFEILRDFLVLPNMASIPDIRAVSYDVCGYVRMADAGYKAKVALTHGPENVKPQVRQADQNGNFCFQVPPGDYRLSAMASTPENAPELVFLPPYTDVSVRSPLLNIEFSQAQVKIHGEVVCKERCGSSISITLVRLGKSNKGRTVRLTDEHNKFTFLDVFPGKYRVEVKYAPADTAIEEDRWCWEQSSIDVDVGTEDVEGILFSHKGYWVDVTSSHDVDARMIQPDGESLPLKIKKGLQRLCVESPGLNKLEFVNSCIFFGSSSINIDTANLMPVHLKGEKYLVKGQINVDRTSVTSVELPESIVIDVFENGNVLADGTIAKLLPDQSDETEVALYKYSMWVNPGQKITIIPSESRTLTSATSSSINRLKKILFYPRQHQIAVTHDGCQGSVPSFTGRLGLYIEGSVSPSISGVSIRIIAAGDSHNAPLKKGELALEISTGSDGVFVGGPLYDDISYTLEASKPGYHLKAVGPHSFSCQKLGQISVHIYSKEVTEEPFPSALLSLSGDDGYRNNSITGVGGHFAFENLFPGSFYLRPLLKEYAFSPRAQPIELGSGESKEVVFEATRVAYSAMGMITLLSGQPREGISIEARAESKGYYEETTTDSFGFYRLRGLLPDTTYIIKVAKKNDLPGAGIERASPESITVKVGFEDIKGLDFVVFEEPERSILSCHVEGERNAELDSHLWVEVKSAGEPSKVKSSFPLPLSRFFQVKDLPKGKHLLQLRSALPLTTHKFISDVIEVDIEKHRHIHVGPLRYRINEDIQIQELTAAPVFPLVVGVSVILLFMSIPRIKDLVSGISMPGSTSTAKKEARKPVVRKKTF